MSGAWSESLLVVERLPVRSPRVEDTCDWWLSCVCGDGNEANNLASGIRSKMRAAIGRMLRLRHVFYWQAELMVFSWSGLACFEIASAITIR